MNEKYLTFEHPIVRRLAKIITFYKYPFEMLVSKPQTIQHNRLRIYLFQPESLHILCCILEKESSNVFVINSAEYKDNLEHLGYFGVHNRILINSDFELKEFLNNTLISLAIITQLKYLGYDAMFYFVETSTITFAYAVKQNKFPKIFNFNLRYKNWQLNQILRECPLNPFVQLIIQQMVKGFAQQGISFLMKIIKKEASILENIVQELKN